MGSMIRLRTVAFALAALGLVSSTLVHVASWFAVVPMGSVWPLHIGILALGVPFAIMFNARRRGRLLGPSWRELLADAPPWGERAFQLVFLYCVLQFGVFLLARSSLSHDHLAPPGSETRMFSAGWMAIYLLFTLAWWKGAPAALRTRASR
jgi:hypothetical protein